MSKLTIEELFQALVESAGEAETGVTPSDSLDVPFADIGYDSLALMETAARITQRTGVTVDDQQLIEAETPRQLLDLLNTAMSGQP
ncbi:acyl carrier protein [Solihabitans fulvus]|uniref:Acyl carrier protein n=1 Tax=Solihabitans fulvus TaxID=1892852 RepID=A0A5B2XIH4_9PSEU|nr:acyl carrier protein [Solihabitans fulvus]KAA2262590.1 acyl carrier protein [Solihabitans fulvus]